MQFSATNTVDQDAISQRDRSKPFVFPLNPLRTAYNDWTFLADKGTDFKVSFPTDPSLAGQPSQGRVLTMQIRSDVDENVKDKIVLTPLHGDSARAIASADGSPPTYVSFDMKLAPDYQVPDFWLLHFQVLQCCGPNPPFTLQVEPHSKTDGPVVLTYGIRDDLTATIPHHPERILFRQEVNRNQWHRVAFLLKPRPLGDSEVGQLTAWLDGRQLFDYHGAWGYSASDHHAHGAGFDIGIYRRRQRTQQTVSFNDVYYGTSAPSGCSQ